MIPVEKLKSLKIFSDISSENLNALAKGMEEMTYEKDEVIIKEGESTNSLFLVAEGFVAVQKEIDAEGSQKKTVARLESEEFFGEMAFLENQAHSASIVAGTQVRIYSLPRKALDEIFQLNAQLALSQVMTLLSGVSSRLRRTTSELVTVYEVSRTVGKLQEIKDLMGRVLELLSSNFDSDTTLLFYRWNPFNEEYEKISGRGDQEDQFEVVLDVKTPFISNLTEDNRFVDSVQDDKPSMDPLKITEGAFMVSRSEVEGRREGLFVIYSTQSHAFDSGQKQLLETVSGVMAPALVTLRHQEEELARIRMEQTRQQNMSL